MSDEQREPFYLVTDGSGHKSGYGGFAALIKAPGSKHNIERVFGGSTHTSVDRMEFQALLTGLQRCSELRPKGTAGKWPLWWWSDRESLVKSVRGEYRRKSAPDMWQAFAYFEGLFDIQAQHIKVDDYDPENESPWLIEADQLASAMFNNMSAVGESFKEVALSKALIDYGITFTETRS